MRTKILCISIIIIFFCNHHLHAGIEDPIKDFLNTQAYSIVNYDPNLYEHDQLLKLNLDINGDGQKFVLLSHNRSRSGKQGLVWIVYKQKRDGSYKRIGDITFHENGFFLGYVDELKHNALVTIGTAGAGKGIIWAYYVDNNLIVESKLGTYDLGSETVDNGQFLLKKYHPNQQRLKTSALLDIINLSTIAPHYDIMLHREE